MSDLNTVEFVAMNNPIRRFVQRHWELRAFERMRRRAGVDLVGKRILDAGCGSGFGLTLLDEAFRPSRLLGIDGMQVQVDRARRRAPAHAEVRVGDITAITEPDASFDAIFVFGVLHHVPEWRIVLVEFARLLAPGGALFVEEIEGRAVDFEDRFLGTHHPKGARFSWRELRAALGDAHLDVIDETPIFGAAAHSFLARAR